MNIKLNTAKLAKEKGFNIEVRGFYYPASKFGEKYQEGFGNLNNNKLQLHLDDKGIKREIEKYSAPTQSELQKWLREVHHIHIDVEPMGDLIDEEIISSKPNGKWYSTIVDITPNKILVATDIICLGGEGNSYEEALEIGLLTALNQI